MAGGAMDGDDDDLITDINVTPLVDVVLVLLIILMVTATAIVSKTIPMQLPTSGTTQPTENTPTTVAISIDDQGDLFLDREPMTDAALLARLTTLRQEDPETRAILAADGRIQHQRVINVIDILREAQITKIAFNARPSDLEGE